MPGHGGGDDHTLYNAAAMGQSQTTFRRTPLRVRVEDLMMGVVNEASQDPDTTKLPAERYSISSTGDQQSLMLRLQENENASPVNQI